MARNEQERTVRADVPGVGQGASNVTLRPNRRNLNAILGTNQDPVRKAAALTKALGFGVEAYQEHQTRKYEKGVEIGRQAALSGRELTPEEQQHIGAVAGLQEISDERAFLELQGAVEKWFAETDTTTMSPEDIVKIIGEQYIAPQLDGLDRDDPVERATGQRYAKWSEKLLQTVLVKHQQEAQELLQQEAEADMDAILHSEASASGTVDWSARNSNFVKLYGAKNANEEMIRAAASLAAEGNVQAIKDLRAAKHWTTEDGRKVPAPGSIRKYDQPLLNLLRVAEDRRAKMDSEDEVKSLKVTKAQNQQYLSDVTLEVLNGRPADDLIRKGLAEGSITAAQAQTLKRFSDGYADQSDAEVNYEALWQYRQLTMQDDYDLDNAEEYLMILADGGPDGEPQLGSFETRAKIVEGELRRINQLRNARLSDPTTKAEMAKLQNTLRVSKVSYDTNPTHRENQTNAEAEMVQLIIDGTPAAEARKAALKKYPKPGEEGETIYAKAVTRVLDGSQKIETLIQYMPDGMTLTEYAGQLEEHGLQLTIENREKLSKAYSNR